MSVNRKRKRWKRILTAALAVCFCLAAVPFSAFALPEGDPGEAPEEGSRTAEWTELTDRRELTGRTFLSEDGREVAALYPYPVFYQDGDTLVPYDYRLELVSGEEDVKEYRVRDGSMESSVRRFFSGGEFLRLGFEGGERTVAFSLPAAKGSRAKTPEFKVQAGLYGGDRNGTAADTVAARYIRSYGLCEGALTGIDVGVEQWPGNAVISAVFQKTDRAEEGLVLSAAFDGLTMEESPSGSLRFFAAGKEVAVLEAPIVYDGKRAVGKASYMLSDREDGATQILVKPEDEWMDALARTGPVTIHMHLVQPGMEAGISPEIQSTEGYFAGVPIAAGNTRETVQTKIALPALPALSEGKTMEQVSLVFGRGADPEEVKSSLELGVYLNSDSGEAEEELLDLVEYQADDQADVCMLDVTKAYEDGSSKGRDILLKSVQTELVTGVYGFDFFVSDVLLPVLLVSSEGTKEEDGAGEYRVAGEDTAKRDPFTKHFLLEDGSRAAAVYEIPVHYRKDGRWEEIDNTLVLDEEAGVYRNRASDLEAAFAEDASAKALVELRSGEGGVSWGFLEAETGADGKGASFSPEAGLEAADTEETGRYLETSGGAEGKSVQAYNAEQMKCSGLTGGGTYSGVLEQVDIRYILDSSELKESILFRSKEAAAAPLRFLVSHPGMEMSLEADGSAVLKRNGETVYTFAAPYMYDWAGNISRAVRFRLEKESAAETVLVMEPDREWLEERGRTYPVAVERTVGPEGRTAVQTAFVREKQPEETSEEGTPLPVGDLSGYGVSRTFLKFSRLPGLGYGERITKAVLNLYQNQYVSRRAADFSAAVYRVSEEWEEDVTWNEQPAYVETVLDSRKAEGLKTGGEASGIPLVLRQFDITGAAEFWYGGENHGLMLGSLEEGVKAGACYTVSNRSVRNNLFPSALYPAGLFYYEREAGLLEPGGAHVQEAGRAGTGYVGDSGGSLVLIHEDLEGTEDRLPGGVSHVYTLARSGEDSLYGNGWDLNVTERLELTGLSALPCIYTDGGGGEHFFRPGEAGEGRQEDVDGLGFVLAEKAGGGWILSREDGSESVFDEAGILLQKKDADGTELFYSYDGGGRLLGLSDAAGSLVSFTYRADTGKLLSVTDETSGLTVSCQYDAVGNLTGILRPDGKQSSYAYDERKLIRAKEADGTAVEYLYGEVCGTERIRMARTWRGGSAADETFSYGER